LNELKKPCEYCGQDLPLGVDKPTRQVRSYHFFHCTAAQPQEQEPEQETQAYREAAQLAKWLFKTHYAQEEAYVSGRVIWGLCDTTAGVISQIDNMVCKLVLPKEQEQEREWVGLTDEEIHSLPVFYEDRIIYQVVKLAEAKLKEKNFE
jgi:hypothetical protein